MIKNSAKWVQRDMPQCNKEAMNDKLEASSCQTVES